MSGALMFGNIGSLGLYPGIQLSNVIQSEKKNKKNEKKKKKNEKKKNEKKKPDYGNDNLMVLKKELVKMELKGLSSRLY
tara:strand:- start:255 stop:491 length:237 start_codon:yes stop_codon:yes gene_type:complete